MRYCLVQGNKTRLKMAHPNRRLAAWIKSSNRCRYDNVGAGSALLRTSSFSLSVSRSPKCAAYIATSFGSRFNIVNGRMMYEVARRSLCGSLTLLSKILVHEAHTMIAFVSSSAHGLTEKYGHLYLCYHLHHLKSGDPAMIVEGMMSDSGLAAISPLFQQIHPCRRKRGQPIEKQ